MMSRELMKTISVCLTSSMCTAMFVVACTAGAEKMSEGGDGSGGSSDDGGDGPGDDGDDGDGMSAADLAALEARVLALEDFKSSSLCFIGHMTDDQWWKADNTDEISTWGDIPWDDSGYDHGATRWEQGPNSDAMKAYDDCF
jgi:hypothetical protein